jgi:hypothetical protein
MTKPEEFSKINLEDMIRRVVEPKVEQAIMKIREEVNKKSSTEAPGVDDVPGIELTGGEFDEASIEGVNEIDLFKRLVYAEAGGEGFLGMALVARSVLNRTGLIQSGKVPPGTYLAKGKSLTNIIMAPEQYTPISNGKINQKLSKSQLDQAMQAIELAKDPNKLIEKLRAAKIPENQITLLMASTGFRNYAAGAGHDPSQKVNEINFKRHTFNTAGNTSLLVPRGVNIQQAIGVTGKIPKADYVKGVFDESGEPGFDVTWKGNNNIAVLPGRVKEIGPLYGSGYGNVVVVESIDPVTGKKVDVLYAHFPNGGITVRENQQVKLGQVLGRMGKPGEPGIGNVSGQHASIDFYNPNSKKGQISGRYSRWQQLSSEIISSAQSGRLPSNWKASTDPSESKANDQSSQPKEKLNPLETEISQQLRPTPTPPKTSEAYMINGKMYYVDTKGQGKVTDQNGAAIDFSEGKNKWLLKEIQTRRQIQKKKYGGLVYSNASRPTLPEEKYASYNDPTMSTQLVIQPIIVQNIIPFQDSKQTIIFAPPVVNSTGKSKELMRS